MGIEKKAQVYLLDMGCGDLILNDTIHVKSKDWIYASDAMVKFYKFMCDSQRREILSDFLFWYENTYAEELPIYPEILEYVDSVNVCLCEKCGKNMQYMDGLCQKCFDKEHKQI